MQVSVCTRTIPFFLHPQSGKLSISYQSRTKRKLRNHKTAAPPSLDTCTALKCMKLKPRWHDFYWTEVYGMGVVLVGKKCYMFGGYRGRRGNMAADFVHEYDVILNVWQSTRVYNADIAFGRVKMAFVYDDKILAYNWHEQERHYNFAALDLIQMDEWRLVSGKAAPNLIQGAAGCYVDSRREGFVCGLGSSNAVITVEVWLYMTQWGTWRKPKTKGMRPSPRINHAVCSRDNVVYIVGGSLVDRLVNRLDIHLMTMIADQFTWSTPDVAGYAPPTRYLFQIVCTGKRVFVYGGYGEQGVERQLDIFHVDKSRWSCAGPRDARGSVQLVAGEGGGTKEHAMLERHGSIWIFGGTGLEARTPLVIRPR